MLKDTSLKGYCGIVVSLIKDKTEQKAVWDFLFTMSADCLNRESTKLSYIENWQFSEDISVIGFPIFTVSNL